MAKNNKLKELFSKKNQKEELSANLFLNIRTIQNNFLYTIDNKVLAYLKIFPKNCKLMSRDEQYAHAKTLTSNLASELKQFKIFITNRPVDLQENQDYQAYLMSKEKNTKKFALLNQRSKSFGLLSTTGKALESETFFMIWEEMSDVAESNLIRRINELKMKFSNSGYKTAILEEKEIIQLIDSYTNPSFAYIEDQNYLEPHISLNYEEKSGLANKPRVI